MNPDRLVLRTMFPAGVIFLLAFTSPGAIAQFSPGELSQVHADLEGLTNCVQCHEVGSEISGAKCLECHKEIRKAIDSRHGFHASTSSQRCAACHKEHLGRNAETLLIDRKTFDHGKTGFVLAGKHASLRCEDCHRPELVRDEEILTMMMERGRASVLGLRTACSSCHTDSHKGTLGSDCQTCHSEDRWSPAFLFDHSKTSFPLENKHGTVACGKCHTSYAGESERIFELPPSRFADCTPCHSSPHRQKLAETCRTCHSTTGWSTIATASFNHDSTGFPLRGKHASTECAKCHGQIEQRQGANQGLSPGIRVCADCHADYHRQEFLAKYHNDCAACHNVDRFTPSTFTLELHDRTDFRLTGAHAATICNSCHKPEGRERHTFSFASLKCTTCHNDSHAGQFDKGKGTVCSDCHTTVTWKLPNFDHSTTDFTLSGKHARIECGKCHKTKMVGGEFVAQYVDTPSRCESCHTDPHAGQFASGTNSACSSCHSPEAWTVLVFNHDTQSSFTLSGAHGKVPCRSCHPVEEIGGTRLVRFKPLKTKCEECHGGKVPDER